MNTSPDGYTIFCDDIRQEVGGKSTFVGIYKSFLYVPVFPTVLPKFCLAITYAEDYSENDEVVTLRVFSSVHQADDVGDEVLIEAELPMAALRKAAEPPVALHEDSVPMANLESMLAISPLVIHRAGLIRVRAFKGDRMVRLGSLGVDLAPAETTD